MHDKKNTVLLSFFEMIILILLIFIRAVIKDENLLWINVVNYTGFLIALWSLFQNLKGVCNNDIKQNYVTGVFVISMILAIIPGVLILTGIIEVTAKINDIILLATLLLTLPIPYYQHRLIRYLN